MADNWMDREEREDREWRRSQHRAGGLARNDAPYGAEDRSFGQERDRVFGERESGHGYNRPQGGPASGYGGGYSGGYQGGNAPRSGGEVRRGEYDPRSQFTSQDYTSGGRFYGDDNRERIYREAYGQGGVEYGDVPRGYDAGGYSPTRARYYGAGYGRPGFETSPPEATARRTLSGGTGGYDYEERGYGDGGRRDSRTERFEDASRHAGESLRRVGEKVASWFSGGGETRLYDPDYMDPNYRGARGARGLGPQGYKRSDDRISEDAHERLTDDHWLDASDIKVAVSGGEVTLSGTVRDREAKHRAERVVEAISGVTHVQNNLRLSDAGVMKGSGSGFGDSAAEAQMRRDDPVANGTGGVGAGQSTAGRKN